MDIEKIKYTPIPNGFPDTPNGSSLAPLPPKLCLVLIAKSRFC